MLSIEHWNLENFTSRVNSPKPCMKSEATEKKVHAKKKCIFVVVCACVCFGKNDVFSWQCSIHPVLMKLRIRHEIFENFRFEWILLLKLNLGLQAFSCRKSSHYDNGQRESERSQVQWLISIWLWLRLCESYSCGFIFNRLERYRCSRCFLKIALTIDFLSDTFRFLFIYISSSFRFILLVSVRVCMHVKRLRLLSFWHSEESHNVFSLYS